MILPAKAIDGRLRAAGRPYDLVTGVPCGRPGTAACGGLEAEARSAGIPEASLIRGVLLTDCQGAECLAVVRAGELIDFDALQALTGRRWEPAGLDAAARRFADCDPGCVPPLGEPYGLRVVVDAAVARCGTVHFEGGRHGCYVRMAGPDFLGLQAGALVGRIARPAPREGRDGLDEGDLARLLPAAELCGRIERLYRLPALPRAAARLRAALEHEETLTPAEAAALVPPGRATERVLAIAASPLLGGERPGDVAAAAAGPLGPGGVVAVAFATVAEGALRVPPGGPLGAAALDREGEVAAALCLSLAAEPGFRPPLSPGLLVAAALLRDVGLRLLAHLFQPEFHLLNRMAAANPATPVPELESHLLALGDARQVVQTGHARLGGWLLREWQAPPPLVAVACAHHRPELDVGEAAWPYVGLAALADALIARAAGCEGPRARVPEAVVRRLGLGNAALADRTRRLARIVAPAARGRGARRSVA